MLKLCLVEIGLYYKTTMTQLFTDVDNYGEDGDKRQFLKVICPFRLICSHSIDVYFT